jgi:hypothetical protein
VGRVSLVVWQNVVSFDASINCGKTHVLIVELAVR